MENKQMEISHIFWMCDKNFSF